jgi:type VI secretion system protein ImpJ
MSWKNKVIWSEGLFLQPQHFQQQDRYSESYVEGRSGSLRSYAWGFTELTIDKDLLSVGKLAISSARGVFPDGTPFNIPDDDNPPPPLDIEESHRDSVIYIGLSTRRAGATEIANGEGDDEGLMRYEVREHEAKDVSAVTQQTVPMRVATLRTRFLTEKDERSDYTCMGVAHAIEVKVDKQVLLEDSYVPPLLSVQANRQLAGFLSELQGLLHHRGEALAGRVSDSGKGGAAEIADFLLLQLTNEWEPFIAHYAAGHLLHPEELFRQLLRINGNLATFTSSTKRPGDPPAYRHDDLRASFAPLMASLRESLSMVIEQSAIPIPLKERSFGIRVGKIADQSLIKDASFVLAASANIPVEELQRMLPAQMKIGSVENIRELVTVQMPGIGLRPLPVAPRQIPFHAGNVYFELDKSSEYWGSLENSGGFAMHVGGEVPGLNLEFWAIRR